jgi:signal peptidase I
MQATVTQVAAQEAREETPLEAFASVLVIGLFALTFIFQNFEIPSSSMEKTLLIGDHVMVDRTTFAPPTSWGPFVYYRNPRHGDIIVFFKPGEPNLYLVKRVIGVPGDRIHLRDGVVYLNGKAQNEPYAGMPNYGDYYPYRDDFPAVPPSQRDQVTPTWALELPNHIQGEDLVVPPGDYFAMGDNRTVSLDGRYWGFVPRADIVGRPLFVYYVLLHFFDQTRWRRMFRRVS